MSTSHRHVHLVAIVGRTGHHGASWRHPSAPVESVMDIEYQIAEAKKAEKALLDALFVAEFYSSRTSALDTFSQLSAIAAETTHIGLINTIPTVYNEPYHIARLIASLDHLSRGRAGWNFVTGADSAAHNFNRGRHPSHSERYEEGDEAVEIIKRLWDSWEDGAILPDKKTGRYVDESRIHEINFVGKHYSVKGPLNLARPPQGHPVVLQSGSSDTGKEMAAKHGEAVYTAHQSLESAQKFYADLKSRLAKYGRTPDQLLILPGLAPLIGETEAEAKELERELNSYIDTKKALDALSQRFEVNLNNYDLDDPVPIDRAISEDKIDGIRSRHEAVLNPARRAPLTIRQLLYRTNAGRGHAAITGTPLQVADFIEEWFRNDGADGFNLIPQLEPQTSDLFFEKVIPELQNRGLFRTQYEGRTLRDHFGLKRPAGIVRN
ncbi:MAG: LLM class flavin-dependent oxidoreductase [Methylacidiphilales bacterium]|nr:LLM class flavin-dependent oxidoreductase [Candidatus Methylacidiphilales bacterium]